LEMALLQCRVYMAILLDKRVAGTIGGGDQRPDTMGSKDQ